jgi:transposase
VQSRYVRQLADIPWQNRAVKLVLHVRRFACENTCCSQQLFCERLDPVASAYARRTQRLANTLTVLGVSVGAKPGAQVAQHLGKAASRDTLLRQVRRAPLPVIAHPRVAGIDDGSVANFLLGTRVTLTGSVLRS